MSATHDPTDCGDSGADPSAACQEYPEFDLVWDVDDPVEPSEVTISPPEPERPTTEWLSVDAADAIPLEQVQ